MNKAEIIYLACPYTHPEAAVQQERYEKVSRVAGLLIKQGFLVYSPISHGVNIAKHCAMSGDYAAWQKHCLAFLGRSKYAIALLLEGYEDSIGLTDELSWCRMWRIPCIDVEYECIIAQKDLKAFIINEFDKAELKMLPQARI
jgi:hypothetical protein